MGKANRPFVVRIKPGESKEEAIKRAMAGPNASKRKSGKFLIRMVSK